MSSDEHHFMISWHARDKSPCLYLRARESDIVAGTGALSAHVPFLPCFFHACFFFNACSFPPLFFDDLLVPQLYVTLLAPGRRTASPRISESAR